MSSLVRQRTAVACTTALGIALGALGALVTPAAAHARAADPWISVIGGPEFPILARNAVDTLRVPVTLANGVNGAGVTLQMVEVSFTKARTASLMTLFRGVTLDTATAERGTALLVPMRLDSVPGAGAYTLVIEARSADRAPVRLTFQVVHPAAKLQVVPPIVVEHVRAPWAGNPDAALPLHETGRQSQISALRVEPVSMTAADGSVVSGSIDVSGASAIGAGGTVQARVRPTGKFPLGVSRGVVEVIAPQLDVPLAISVEVRTRLTRVWLVVATVIGLALGYLLRTLVKRAVDLETVRLTAFPIAERLADASATGDITFRRAVAAARDDLEPALVSNVAADITAAVARVDAAFRAAVSDLEQRLGEATKLLRADQAVVGSDWLVPAPIAAALVAPAGRLAEVQAAIARRDADGAQQRLHEVERALADALRPLVETWAAGANARRAELAGAGTGFPSAISDQLRAVAEELAGAISNAAAPIKRPSAAEFERVLSGVEHVERAFRETLEQLRESLARVAGELRAVFAHARPLPDPAAVEALGAELAAFDAELAARGDRPPDGAPLFSTSRLDRLDAAWADAVLRQVGDDAELRDVVDGHVADRAYVEAARAVVSARRAARRGAVDGAEATLADAGGGLTPVTLSPARPANGADALGDVAPLPLPALRVLKARTMRELFRAQLIGTLGAGFGIVVVGYLLFAPSFVGTPEDLASILLWGFGLDVTVNGFTEVARQRAAR